MFIDKNSVFSGLNCNDTEFRSELSARIEELSYAILIIHLDVLQKCADDITQLVVLLRRLKTSLCLEVAQAG